MKSFSKNSELFILIITNIIESLSILALIFFDSVASDIIITILLILSILAIIYVGYKHYQDFNPIYDAIKINISLEPFASEGFFEIMSNLNIPSLEIEDKMVKYQVLDLTINEMSNSLETKTKSKTEDETKQIYDCLKRFKESFDLKISQSTDEYQELGLKITLDCEDWNNTSKYQRTFPRNSEGEGLTLKLFDKGISIIINPNHQFLTWKKLKNRIKSFLNK